MLVIFLLVLNFVLAIIVEAYMKVCKHLLRAFLRIFLGMM